MTNLQHCKRRDINKGLIWVFRNGEKIAQNDMVELIDIFNWYGFVLADVLKSETRNDIEYVYLDLARPLEMRSLGMSKTEKQIVYDLLCRHVDDYDNPRIKKDRTSAQNLRNMLSMLQEIWTELTR